MTLTDTVTIYPSTSADQFGNDVLGDGIDVAAVVDATYSWRHASFADMDGSSLSAWISPDEDVWQDNGPKLVGCVAAYMDQTYRIAAVKPGGSLITGSDDLVELGLTQLEHSDVS